jgi:cell filamentation protein
MATNDKGEFNSLFYPGTETLINRFGEKDPAKLAKIEQDRSQVAALDARLNPVKGNFDLAHMQDIHRRIFQEVYPWAGQVRDYPIFKRRLDGLVTEFAPPDEIPLLDRQLKEIMAATKSFSTLQEKDVPEAFARAYQIANDMHPFREGNGRTHRIYLGYLANRAGVKLDFRLVDKDAWNYAASMSGKVSAGAETRIDGRTDELAKVFKHITTPAEKQNAYAQGRAGQVNKQAAVMTLSDLNPKLAAQKKAAYRVR